MKNPNTQLGQQWRHFAKGLLVIFLGFFIIPVFATGAFFYTIFEKIRDAGKQWEEM